jgi:hypothetical protein
VDFDGDGVYTDYETNYAGATASWNVTVCNTGDAPVYDIWVLDSNGLNECCFTLNPGDCETFIYDMVIDVDTVNTACADGFDELGGFVNAGCDPAEVHVVEPALSIEKTVDFDGDGVYTDSETNTAGETASWKIVVCNTGAAPVYDIVVTDTNGNNFGAPFDLLNNGDCEEFIYDMVMNDDTVNTACAQGIDELGGAVGPVCDPAEVMVLVVGEQGCTPGFWKVQPNFEPTHCWCETYDPNDLVSEVFAIPASLINTGKGPGLLDTLDEALAYGGGKGVEGAARNLLRSAVAAVLNACNDNVAYPMGEQAVILAVNEALATLDRDAILALHTTLDGYNNLGCSIDNHCNPILIMVD